ncbi:unnamed protein product, partial [Nesidiocoris tenuis]
MDRLIPSVHIKHSSSQGGVKKRQDRMMNLNEGNSTSEDLLRSGRTFFIACRAFMILLKEAQRT